MKKLWLLCLTALLPVFEADCQKKILIDADTGNEVDDIVAIARALMSDEVEVVGLTAAQWNHEGSWMRNTVEESRQLNLEILSLMGKEQIPAPMGSEQTVTTRLDGSDIMQVKMIPRKSAASDFILEKVRAVPEGEKLTILVLGALTNVASALLEDPLAARKMSVHYIGMLYDTGRNVWNKNEFNSRNDLNALDAVLNTDGLELHIMPANVTNRLTFPNKSSMARLEGMEDINGLILRRWKLMVPEPNDDWGWIMWDLALVHAILHPEWVETKIATTPPENLQRPVTLYTRIDHEKMAADFWKHFGAKQGTGSR